MTMISESAKILLSNQTHVSVRAWAKNDAKRIHDHAKKLESNEWKYYTLEEFIEVNNIGIVKDEDRLKLWESNGYYKVSEITDDEWEKIFEAYNDQMIKERQRLTELGSQIRKIQEKAKKHEKKWIYTNDAYDEVKQIGPPEDATDWEQQFKNLTEKEQSGASDKKIQAMLSRLVSVLPGRKNKA